MATTPNYGWVTPAPTDLVTDLPADFETFADAVDADLAGLLGGSTGQVLKKTSNADHAFAFGVDPTFDLVTTAGDLVYGTAADTMARLGIGTAGQVLKVNSGATAPEWGTVAAGGGKVLQVISATYGTETVVASTSYTDTGLTATITPSLASSKVLILTSQTFFVRSSSQEGGGGMKLLRGATTVMDLAGTNNYGAIYIFNSGGTESQITHIAALAYLDSPNTTSATTYKVQIASLATANNGRVSAQYNNSTSSIILLEIGA